MKTQNLGYPRIGANRELKRACEKYWAGKISSEDLIKAGKEIRQGNWQLQQEAGIDLIPCNDFSFYDQVLDMVQILGCVPERFSEFDDSDNPFDQYFAMARGFQKDGIDVTAMEMTKWFDTNYHYIVPEFQKDQTFELNADRVVEEYKEAKTQGIEAKPVLIGPVTFLLLGKEKEGGFHRIDLLFRLLPVYTQLVGALVKAEAEYIQFDEPCLAGDLTEKEQSALKVVYAQLRKNFPDLKMVLANYFDCYGDNLETALSLPVDVLHLDLVRCPSQLDDILDSGKLASSVALSLGLVDGRNVWKNDFSDSLKMVKYAMNQLGEDRVLVSPSCSLLHSPCDLSLEKNLSDEIKQWLAFARQKLQEVVLIKELACEENMGINHIQHEENVLAAETRAISKLIHNEEVKRRVAAVKPVDAQRNSAFKERQIKQREALNLPLFPTTTIGSFPQTKEVRQWRSRLKKGEINDQEYDELIGGEITRTIRIQEEIGLDVLVHGEPERNDMVEFFGEKLNGFAFTNFGWVQSYGSRCVKPPIIYGDVSRPEAMTVSWSAFAQSLTDKPVKGMLTGPVTILQWSFVRNDQPRRATCNQIALAIRDEVQDLEKAGLRIIQIDEPAIREGLPLRRSEWSEYLQWAVKAFRLAASGVQGETQVHTHMCYSEFNDIIEDIAAMDADVITIECSRSQMELLDAFAEFAYPNEIGPGVYDIHSPRVPSEVEMSQLMEKAIGLIPNDQLWVNPDCGLKTRGWEETKLALEEMVACAKGLRKKHHPEEVLN